MNCRRIRIGSRRTWRSLAAIRRASSTLRQEPFYESPSPAGTLWATDLNNPGKFISAANWAELTFNTWVNAYGGSAVAGNNVVPFTGRRAMPSCTSWTTKSCSTCSSPNGGNAMGEVYSATCGPRAFPSQRRRRSRPLLYCVSASRPRRRAELLDCQAEFCHNPSVWGDRSVPMCQSAAAVRPESVPALLRCWTARFSGVSHALAPALVVSLCLGLVVAIWRSRWTGRVPKQSGPA